MLNSAQSDDLSESALERVLSFLSPSAVSKLSIDEIRTKANALIESEKVSFSQLSIKFSLIYEHLLMTRDWLCLPDCRVLALFLMRFCFSPNLPTCQNTILCRVICSMPYSQNPDMCELHALKSIMDDNDSFIDPKSTATEYCANLKLSPENKVQYLRMFKRGLGLEPFKSRANPPTTEAPCVQILKTGGQARSAVAAATWLTQNDYHNDRLEYFKKIACGPRAPLFHRFKAPYIITMPKLFPVTAQQLPIPCPILDQIDPVWHDGILDEIRLKDLEDARKIIYEAAVKSLTIEKRSVLQRFIAAILFREPESALLYRPPKMLEKLGFDLQTASLVVQHNVSIAADILITSAKNKFDIRTYVDHLCCRVASAKAIELFELLLEGVHVPSSIVERFVSNSLAVLAVVDTQTGNNNNDDQANNITQALLSFAKTAVNRPKICLSKKSIADLESLVLRAGDVAQHEDVYGALKSSSSQESSSGSTTNSTPKNFCDCSQNAPKFT